MTRKTLALAVILALLLGLSTAVAELDPNEQVSLRFAWWGAQLRHDRTQQIVDMYTEMHPNVTIETEFYDWDSYWDKLAAQGAGGVLPDLIQMSTSYVVQYYEGGLLLNLEPYVENGILDLSDIPPNTLDQGRLGPNGDLYAMNLGMNALMALYDPAITDAAGIEITQRYTYDDLYAWGRIIKEKTGVYTNLYTNQPTNMMRSQGSHLFKQDGSGDIGFDDPALLAYFSELKLKGIEEGISLPPEVAAERAGSVDESFFVIGEEWINFTWSNIASAIINAAQRELMYLPYPSVPGKEEMRHLNYTASQQICANASTKHPDWAADFIDYMINSVECNEVLLAERGMPVNTKVSEAIQPLL
ncbi:MAG: extracellular solute-binding protein, partial [Clostridia bacterium]|nr:extracellular solute-binding protein [Clostridia bacterium]